VSVVTAGDVRSVVLAQVVDELAALGLASEDVPDELDLLYEGVIDSLRLLEIITALEDHFATELDFEDVDPDEMTVLGPFCRHVERQVNAARS
jgi:acyl carrier protein